MEYCMEHVPKWNTISISGYHIREAGSTAAQELAFTIADGMTYVEAAMERGLKVDDFAPRLAFFFNAHNDLFEEVAKFRAARRMWARIMKERFGARDPRSLMMRFHAQTGGSTLAAQEPENNVVRVTIQALAAVLGGTQSLHTNSMDEALSLPTEKAARIALRTQQIIAQESGVPNTVDPAGGSYYLEALTDELEADAEAYIARIDGMGGMLRAIERGYVQREIQDAAYRFAKDLEAKERIVVAVNEFGSMGGKGVPLHKIDDAVEARQVESVKKHRLERDQRKTETALSRLRRAAAANENLMPLIVEAARSEATTGEICGTMREIFHEYEPPADI
jgi:methylmalonyl-CoA mutase N-terminal domain/subunit